MPPLCSQCGQPLNLLETVANVHRGPTVYPRHLPDGTRAETLVQWVCRRCQRRAERHRRGGEADAILSREPKRRVRTARSTTPRG